MIASVKFHTKNILLQKSSCVCVCVISTFVVVNFLMNVYKYQGLDLVEMYHPMKLILLSEHNGAIRYFFLQVFPFLSVLPGGFSFIRDTKSGMRVYFVGREGREKYMISKLISVFLVCFMVFVIPLLGEIILNCIAFPMQAIGDPSNLNLYDEIYIDVVSRYLFCDIFVLMPYIYAVLMSILFSIVAAVLCVFTYAISLCKLKYRIALFLPVYILLHGLAVLQKFFSLSNVSLNYFNYLTFYDNYPKSELGLILLLCVILIVSVGIVLEETKKDFI